MIANLTNLRHLNLHENQITVIPEAIANLTDLQYLNLYSNQITAIPKVIANLTNLRHLNLHSNQITVIPETIANLTDLQYLNLHSNQITVIPDAIANLTNLQGLYLNSNQIILIPDAIANLTSLEYLDLDSNQITVIPDAIANLTNLQGLYLNSNQINVIPDAIANLTNLQRLVLQNNPIINVPPEIIRQGWGNEVYENGKSQIIIDYLNSNIKFPLNEFKLLLVGEGDVGKTSLLNRFVEDKFNPDETKTPGINIKKQWQVPHGDPEMKINIWDFGGQRVMHNTHQFFLTKRSLYLLVIDNRKNEQQNRVEYWLKLIKTYGGDSPVIIIGNCTDEHPLQVKERTLRKKYPQVKKVIATSCKDGNGLNLLYQEINKQIQSMPHVRDLIPKDWLKIKAELEEMQARYDFISYEKYQDICSQTGIVEPDKQKNLVEILNDLGVVLNFQDDPRLNETNVLNPEWVTSGVYDILNNHALMTDKKGILPLADLSSVLKEPKRYPANKQRFLMGLMEKFELCYPLENYSTPHYLISDLLPIDEPDVDELETAPLHFQYRYDILPSSIITSFIVRNHTLIYKNTRWRSGTLLIQDGNKALIRADEEDNLITIKVQGRSADTLLATIRADFTRMHIKIPDLAVRENLVVTEQGNTGREVPVDYNYLCDLERGNIQTSPLPNLRGTYNIADLLAGVESAAQRQANLDQRLALSRKSRDAQPMQPIASPKQPSLMKPSLVWLFVLFTVALIFAVIAHFIPATSLFITVVGIIVVFPVLSVMVLLVTGKIDQATMSKALEGFWAAVPALAGKKSEQPENQSADKLPPTDDQ